MLSRWVIKCETKESEPTNSTDFDPIFNDLSPFLFRNIVGCLPFVEDSFIMTSNVTWGGGGGGGL